MGWLVGGGIAVWYFFLRGKGAPAGAPAVTASVADVAASKVSPTGKIQAPAPGGRVTQTAPRTVGTPPTGIVARVASAPVKTVKAGAPAVVPLAAQPKPGPVAAKLTTSPVRTSSAGPGVPKVGQCVTAAVGKVAPGPQANYIIKK